jgi:hypothetical protein
MGNFHEDVTVKVLEHFKPSAEDALYLARALDAAVIAGARMERKGDGGFSGVSDTELFARYREKVEKL